ncbi:MAG: hypothetical protein ACRC8M_02985, partial [Cetobacterium sp.]|uniref:hypothetical protein n=1 Tax=Cetobacterium sp. TaxID=2071632 RepID=UPI003F342DFA
LANETVWDNLYNRFAYGTSGAGILLSFKADNYEMGQIIEKEKGKEVGFSVSVLGTDELKVEVLCNNKVIIEKESINRACDFVFIREVGKKEDFYYVRVTQKDDHQAWGSPIWIKNKY